MKMEGFCIKILSLCPKMWPGPLAHSLVGDALESGVWTLDIIKIRDFATDKHKTVDAPPFGGGAGMLMRADVVARAIDATHGCDNHPHGNTQTSREMWPLIFLSPRGKQLEQSRIRELALCRGMSLLCGRYEGVDERVLAARGIEEISIGDFVLSGGDIAAMALVDAVVRLLPGVVGNPESLVHESFSSGLLEYPQYTRPRVWEGMTVPSVLLSGNHKEIQSWQKKQAEHITKERRPELWKKHCEL
jgi:tRNA (guanine37-N1)-methyltransferase